MGLGNLRNSDIFYIRGQLWHRSTNCDCGCEIDKLWVRFPLEEINYLIFLFSHSGIAIVSLSSATQHAMRPVFDVKLGNGSVLMETECLNIRMPDFTIFKGKRVFILVFGIYYIIFVANV